MSNLFKYSFLFPEYLKICCHDYVHCFPFSFKPSHCWCGLSGLLKNHLSMNTTSARKTKRFAPYAAPPHFPFRISLGNRKFFDRTGNGHKYSHFIQFNDEILPVVRWRNRQFEQNLWPALRNKWEKRRAKIT